MRSVILGVLTMFSLTWGAAVLAGDDATDPLKANRMEIRSMLEPGAAILSTQPVAVALPANASIGDKQLLLLIKNTLIAEGYTVTTPDKSAWTVVGTVKDQSSSTDKADGNALPATAVQYASVTVMVCPNNDLASPVWTSSVWTYDYFWINHQGPIVRAILATYGMDFYNKNEEPKDVLEDVSDKDNRPTPPTVDEIKHCLANPNPKTDSC